MKDLKYKVATAEDVSFIAQVYRENIHALHGNDRTEQMWLSLLEQKDCIYYIVWADVPVAWFRLEQTEQTLWLDMLQVKPAFRRRGVGSYILSVTEAIARETGCAGVGIHTTEDNAAARGLYLSAGYEVTEIGPCTTADGIERVGYTFQKFLPRP